MIAFAILMTPGTGSRLKQVEQQDVKSGAPVLWKKGNVYFCTQKWEKRSGKYVDKFCLANMEEVLDASEKGARHFKVSHSLSPCIAQSMKYRFKICNIKGKQDMRLNYAEKSYAPKGCFQRMAEDFATPDGSKIPLLIASVTYKQCREIYQKPVESQNVLERQQAQPVAKKPDLEPAGRDEFDWDNLNHEELTLSAEGTTTTTTTIVDIVDVDEALLEEIEPDGLGEEMDLGVGGVGGVVDNLDVIEDALDHEEVKSKSIDLADIAAIRNLWLQREAIAKANAGK
jgi:hypothetical protein